MHAHIQLDYKHTLSYSTQTRHNIMRLKLINNSYNQRKKNPFTNSDSHYTHKVHSTCYATNISYYFPTNMLKK